MAAFITQLVSFLHSKGLCADGFETADDQYISSACTVRTPCGLSFPNVSRQGLARRAQLNSISVPCLLEMILVSIGVHIFYG